MARKPKLTTIQIVCLARSWIADVQEWTANSTAESFSGNSQMQAAAHRAFMAIGEAIKDLPPSLLEHEPDVPWNDAIGLRNVLAHDYFEGIEQRTVWVTIKEDLPVLDAALARLEARLKEGKI
jgi:uncharacterized protein with HEPN domain